ncbi:MAG TPA: exodeoxyribonuclease VII large subunit [Stellaceae bacterium]|jgi:exodeoxyribonuclease VII large subunit|nr:exodeoxyribonuclease VII large subunit [Stellaceae bacterium]
MNDLPLASPLSPVPGANLLEYTVSELSLALKRSIEDGFGHVRVRGEISGFKRVGSGHCYFALKDAEAVIDAVCWRTTAMRLNLRPADGMEVICNGRLTTYPGRSKYQLIVDSIELAGIGALLRLLEERRQRLAAEGLFAAERKKKLPFLPQVIGIVTSPTGAVIRDILHRLADRFPRRVLLWPVIVQGDGAAAQVAAAIEGFNRIAAGGHVPRPDLIIVARGGGSLEDLMAFNEEIVVRAAAASAIPLISAVGHETDTTLIDHASDRRAPTPTAAAEMAVPVRLDLVADLGGKASRLAGGLSRLFGERRLHLAGLARGLPDPHDLLGAATQRLDDRSERLRLAIHTRLAGARQRLDVAAAGLRPTALAADINRARERFTEVERRLTAAMAHALAAKRDGLDNFAGRLATHSEHHESLLARGYAVVWDSSAKLVEDARTVRPGAALELEFYNGKVGVIAGGSRRPVRRSKPLEGQGNLFWAQGRSETH